MNKWVDIGQTVRRSNDLNQAMSINCTNLGNSITFFFASVAYKFCCLLALLQFSDEFVQLSKANTNGCMLTYIQAYNIESATRLILKAFVIRHCMSWATSQNINRGLIKTHDLREWNYGLKIHKLIFCLISILRLFLKVNEFNFHWLNLKKV